MMKNDHFKQKLLLLPQVLFNKGIRFLLCFIDIFSKHSWVTTITNTFRNFLNESNRRPNKIRVDKRSEFYIRSLRSWPWKNAIEMHSTHNKGKSVVAKKIIRTLKNKIHKYMTSISRNVYINKLDYIVNKSNNAYHITIKMKPTNVELSTYINFNKEINK